MRTKLFYRSLFVFLLSILPLSAKGQLKADANDAVSQKFSLTTRLFLEELKSGDFDPVKLEAKKRARKIEAGLRKLDPVQRIRHSKNDGRFYAKPDTINGKSFVSAFIRLEDNNDVDALEALGVQVRCKFKKGLITSEIPVDKIADVAALDIVREISVAKIMHPSSNLARMRTNVDDVLTQTADALRAGLNTKYDGKGVLLGIVDEGIDFQHIAFKDKDGNSRIVGAYINNGKVEQDYDASTISSLTTDNTEEDHGTHTASIAGGSSVIIDGGNVTVTEDHANANYGGMAPCADLFLCGIENEVDVAEAFDRIVNYADERGMPVVISNSWGTMAGRHAGTGDLATVCETYFHNNPNHICLFSSANCANNSADNENGGVFVTGFSSETIPLRTIIRQKNDYYRDAGCAYTGMLAYACTRSLCTELACKLYVLDNNSGEILSTIPITESGVITGIDDYYSGELRVSIDNKDEILLYTIEDETIYTRQSDSYQIAGETYYKSKYSLAIEIYPKTGSCQIDMWGDYGYFSNHLSTSGISWTAGNDNMSVCDPATIPDIISVGAYVSRNVVVDCNNDVHNEFANFYTLGDIAPFSSYALSDYSPTKQNYPWITAPGAQVIAAVNSQHKTGKTSFINGNSTNYSRYRVNENTTYPYGNMDGTSMSCPVVAGIVALWLQAAKEMGSKLTTDDVKRIMKETAIHDDYTDRIHPSQFGNGKIDALAGIAKILAEGQKPRIEVEPARLEFEGATGQVQTRKINVKGLYLSGSITATLNDGSGLFSIDKSSVEALENGTDIVVTWSPTEVGNSTAVLRLTADGADEKVIILTGHAEDMTPRIGVSDNQIEITSRVGYQISKTVTINSRHLVGDITLGITAGDGAFSVSPTKISKTESGNPASGVVSFRPSSARRYTGTLNISSNEVSPIAVLLTGYGSEGTSKLTQYEYWFDDDFDGRTSGSLSGYTALFDQKVDASSLSNGVHKFSFRVKQSGGEYDYSAITSTLFLKVITGGGTTLEYWFDDKIDQRESKTIASDDALQEFELDLRDNTKYPLGFHKLNIRVNIDNQASAIYSTGVYKFPVGNATRLDYWIDNNTADIKTIAPKIANDGSASFLFHDDCDLSGASIGFHKLNMRAYIDGVPGAVYTANVFKQPMGSGAKLEYWLDDNVKDAKPIEGKKANDGSNTYLFHDDCDLIGASIGFHKLNLRVTIDGQASSVYTTNIFKLPMGSGAIFEYWLDGNTDDIKTLTPKIANDGSATYLIHDDCDLTGASIGFHKLNMRVTIDGQPSAVYSTGVYKMPEGNLSKLEYWFDNDKTIRTIPGTMSNDGSTYQFLDDLKIDDLAPGHHRLYYRAVSDDGLIASAVSSTAVVVKTKYDSIIPGNVRMRSYSIAVDNKEPLEMTLSYPGQVVDIDKNYDVRDLTTGEHELKLRFANDAGAGVSLKSTFTVEEQETPVINLMAQESNGLVNIKFNSIPNDISYRIYRVDANGARATLNQIKGSYYPNEMTFTDNPPSGTFRYYAKGRYENIDGKPIIITSNESSVTLAEEAPETEYASISGRILYVWARSYGERNIIFSDGVTVKTNYVGEFYRAKAPVGESLTMTVEEDPGYTFSTESIIVKENYNTVFFTIEENVDYLKANTESPLQFDSFVEVMPRQYYRFTVKNVTPWIWEGYVSVKALLKDYVDNTPTEITPPTNAQALAGSMATYTARLNYNYVKSDKIALLPGETKEIYLPEKSFVWDWEQKYYYFYFESLDENGAKLIALNPDYNLESNPLTHLVEKLDVVDADNRVFEEDVTFAVNLIMHLVGQVKEFDGKLGDFTNYLAFFNDCLKNDIDYVSVDNLTRIIEYEDNYINLFNDNKLTPYKKEIYNQVKITGSQLNIFRDSIATLVRESDNILDVFKDVQKVLDYARAYNEWQGMDDTERMIYFSERILDYAASHGDPFVRILKTYLDVTKITIENAKKLGATWHSSMDADWFSSENQLSESERTGSKKHNNFIDFRIRVKKEDTWYRLFDSYFDAEDLKKQLYDITVTARNKMGNLGDFKAEATFTPVVDGDYVYLRQTGIKDGLSEGDAIEDMWLNIRWKNGRITRVPLRHGKEIKGNGVKYDGLANPWCYTITFQSGASDKDHIADIIKIDD